jgi:transposase
MAQAKRVITGGVDTHKDFHVAVALDDLGRLLGTEQFASGTAGYKKLLAWLSHFGRLEAVGVEGTGSWGAGLARYLASEGVKVLEVVRPKRQVRRRRGKSDPADAEAAARAVLAGEELGTPKAATGPVEAVRLLRIARRSAMKARIQAANQVHAVIDTAPEVLRAELMGLSERARMQKAARLRPDDPSTPLGAAKLALACLAKRWTALSAEIAALDAELAKVVATTAPSLVALKGVGVETAGSLLRAVGDNPARLSSEASFAALCGTSPVAASSGRHQERHRLNRGGDREANTALYMIVLCRLAWHQPTKDYMARRTAEGKTKKEVIRCLKRYVARAAYRAIIADMAPNARPKTGTGTADQKAA